jgi:CheY-like chemotaxis protein
VGSHGEGNLVSKRRTDSRTRVLVAEDDPHALSGYLEFLTIGGFDAVGAANGTDALHLAFESIPHVVVTDVAMPGLDGFALAVCLREDSRTHGIPVIGMTAHWTPDVRAAAVRAGVEALLLKPCLPAHLVAEVRRAIERISAAHP